MNDSVDFKNVESKFCERLSHVSSQLAMIPSSRTIFDLFLWKKFHYQTSVLFQRSVFFHCLSMQRFISKRTSSSVDLDSSSLDDERADRAAIAIVCWSELATSQAAAVAPDAPAGSSCSRSTCSSTMSTRVVSTYSDLSSRHTSLMTPSPQPLSHEEIAQVSTPAAPASPAAPVAALVEDEPRGSGTRRRKIHVDPIVREWLLDVMDQWRTERRSEHAAVLVRSPAPVPQDVRRDQPEHSLYRRKRSAPAAAQLGRRDFAVTRRHDRAERAHHAVDRRPVPQRGDDWRLGARIARLQMKWTSVRPGEKLGEAATAWHALDLREARQVRQSAPQPLAAARQHAPALHRAVLADEHPWRQRRPRREHRRDVLPALAGASHRAARRGVNQAQPQGNTREATTFTVAFSMDRGPLDICWCRSCTRARQTPSCRSSPGRSTLMTSRRRTAGQRRPQSCSSRPLQTT